MKSTLFAVALLACTGSVCSAPAGGNSCFGHPPYPPHSMLTSHCKALAKPVEPVDKVPHIDHEPLVPLGHEHSERSTKTLTWVGPIAPAGEMYAYYGTIKEVGMQMVQVARDAQVHHPENSLVRRKKAGMVCSREDQPTNHYAETWAAYKLAAVLGSLAATNHSAIVAIDGGHAHCVDLTACDEHERARIQLCNDNPKPITVKVQTIAEYAYAIIYECAKQDGSGLLWGQQFDSKDFNVVIDACPVFGEKKQGKREEEHEDHKAGDEEGHEEGDDE